jgi:hypothetical protein
MSSNFTKKIEPLLQAIRVICEEENVEYFTEFHAKDGERYHDSSSLMLLDTSTLFTQIQLWEAKNNMPLIKDQPKEVNVSKKQLLTNYVLENLTLKILSETIKEPELKIEERLGELAIEILDVKDGDYKKMLTDEYNNLKKISYLDIENITANELPYKIKQVFNGKINRTVGTIIHPKQ